jgi:TolA-binding protein
VLRAIAAAAVAAVAVGSVSSAAWLRPHAVVVPRAQHLPLQAPAVLLGSERMDSTEQPERVATTIGGATEARFERPSEASSMSAAGGASRPPMSRPSMWRPPAEAPYPRGERVNQASKAFGVALDLLGRGDYAAARSQLDAFRAAHPADDRADLAAFLTIVSLQRAGRRSEAQEAARRYLELYPNGDRRADAARVASAR